MRVAGIIAEYNPFHNGHLLHIRKTRLLTGCDYVIAVMTGCFTQRGEPALTDKWMRARAALEGGADLVVEMPSLYAVRSAQGFAQGGVRLLAAMGLVDDLSFGCETDDLNLLARIASILRDEPASYKAALRKGLDEGMSYPSARGGALVDILGEMANVVARPNTALALEYLRENTGLKRPMKPLAILREADYHNMDLGPLASAGAIRAALKRNEDVRGAMPFPLQGALSRPEALDALLLYKLRSMDGENLRALPDMPEGLEKRILSMAQKAGSREELISLVKCKRYTHARISRALTHALLDMTGQICRAWPNPPYARALGFKREAAPLLRAISKVSAVPLVTDAPILKGHPVFEQERRATDLWGLCTNDAESKRAGQDLTRRVVIL